MVMLPKILEYCEINFDEFVVKQLEIIKKILNKYWLD